MSEIKKEWYVVRAVGGKEQKVKEYIEAEIRHNHSFLISLIVLN